MGKTSGDVMNKDIVWHELFARMKNDTCPICSLIVDRLDSFMKSILYEGVNDPNVRATISNNEGLCNTHAYQLLALGDPLAHAIIYSDVLSTAIDKMGVLREPVASGREKCVFCMSVEQSESTYVNSFAAFLSDEVFRIKYDESSLLCLPHFKTVQAKIKDPSVQNNFRNSTATKYRKLVGYLNEVKRKNNYQGTNEAWTDEDKSASKNVVAIINGYPGLIRKK